jgi:uracil-DNA glycosylase
MERLKIADVRIEKSWKDKLVKEFESDYFATLKTFLIEERNKYIIYPPASQMFSAFDLCPFTTVKVVILGQDPYHGAGQAHGLCFSVPDGIAFPPSLRNIFKELQSDLNTPAPLWGNLERWAKQGVLLLNATLTVRAEQAGSHQNKGWEQFTDKVIEVISKEKENIVFLLWGNYARAKKSIIDHNKHLVLEAAHPSPLSASRGFLGCRHFSSCNNWLSQKNIQAIEW